MYPLFLSSVFCAVFHASRKIAVSPLLMIGGKDKYMGDFVKVAETKDIQPSKMIAVEVDGEKVCIANVEGKYYAIGNVCTHMGGPLAEGKNLNGIQLYQVLKALCPNVKMLFIYALHCNTI
jgi:nitrite reductase/ring-hydroxylating ferredoxin subunit